MPEKLNLNVREAARILGVSHTQVYQKLLHRPDFPAYRIGERWVIPRDALVEWNRTQAQKERPHEPEPRTTAVN